MTLNGSGVDIGAQPPSANLWDKT